MRYAVGCPTFTWSMPHDAYKDIGRRGLGWVFYFSTGNKKPAALLQRVSLIRSLAMSYFHMANATLSSALFRFTTEFGMESGGSKTLLSPSKMRGKDSRQSASRLRVLCAR